MMECNTRIGLVCGCILAIGLQTLPTFSVLITMIIQLVSPISENDRTYVVCLKVSIPIGLFVINLFVKWVEDDNLTKMRAKLNLHEQLQLIQSQGD